ncbi:MAG: DUF4226 domain-containing protein, partial [Mycobacteriaceae bacterium]|nr:DUF4226 domain-containing protein [Mycobacteriaceae bacterium]
RPTSTGEHPQVPDTLIGALRNHFPGLFDRAGAPITPAPCDVPPPAAEPTQTDEQQSGRTADAVKRLQMQLTHRYNIMNAAEEHLSEALLSAHATTAEGQRKLNDIQRRIVEAVNNPSTALDTPAGGEQFLKFLRAQVGAIADIVKSGALASADQANTVSALAELYAADGGISPEPAPVPDHVAVQEPSADLADSDPLSDLGVSNIPTPDPLSSLASTLPAAMSAVPAVPFGGGMDSLAPLAALASPLSDPVRRDSPTDNSDPKTAPGDRRGEPDVKDATHSDNANGQRDAASGAPAEPSTSVALPDGSTASAASPAVAQAVRAYLAGTPLEAAYRQAGVELPPPGTPVTAPIDPSQLAAGDVGMFQDHYVVALGSAKALKDGQVVPLASAASGPDFLGWMRPTTTAQPAPLPAATVPG